MDRQCMGCMEIYDDQFGVCPYCGYVHGIPAKEAYHITPGSVLIERYVVGRVLGFGGFGITYIGYDRLLEHKVAIKEYMPGEFSTRMPNQQVVTIYSGEREEQFREGMLKILDEARRLAQFQNEPNIVHIYDCFEANNTAYIVMEYLDGESVKALLAREGRIPMEQAMDIVMKVISGMKKVHEIGIIHRDIAPDNIYILTDGNVKILDFGAARYATTKHSKSLSVIIKPGYAPEEQYRSRGDQGPWTDVYAMAATFYKMITGITPEDAMERSVKDLLKKPSKLGASIPKGMETAIMNALNVRIEDRTQSMGEFEEELMAAEVKEKLATQRKTDVGKIPLWGKIAAAGGAIFIVCMIVVLLTVNFMPKLEEYNLAEGRTLVPNLVNLKQEEAVVVGTKKEISVIPDKMKYSAVITAGNVTSQSIPKGSEVNVNSEVRIEISRGKEKVVVPVVAGMAKEVAVKELEKAELTVEIKEISADNVAPGSVVVQSIEGNTTAAKGDTIILEIAKDDGKGDVSIKVQIPELKNMDYKTVQELLKKDYIYLKPSYEYSQTAEAGMIISQAVAPGESLSQKSTIEVVVSMGKEKVQMPGVELTTVEEAKSVLTAKGLQFTIVEQNSESIERGKVISQGVVADEMVEKGTVIQLVISSGKAVVETNAKETKSQQPKVNTTQKPEQNQEAARRAAEENAAKQAAAKQAAEAEAAKQAAEAAAKKAAAEAAARKAAEAAAQTSKEDSIWDVIGE